MRLFAGRRVAQSNPNSGNVYYYFADDFGTSRDMQGRLRERTKKRSSVQENLGILAGVIVGVGLAIVSDHRGMPQKWHAAILGTVVPFGVVVMSLRGRWLRWTFWEALTGCLVVHLLLIWVLFQYALADISHFGTIYWFPVAFVEVFVLIVAVKKVEEKLTGKRETYKLS